MTSRNESSERRSRTMRAVRSTGTAAELTVRHLLDRMRRKYTIDDRTLPGRPDLSLRRARLAIFVHGCFWHGHKCKRGARTPKTNRAYWVAKIERNAARDKRVRGELRKLGWRSLVVWECQLRERSHLEASVRKALRPPWK